MANGEYVQCDVILRRADGSATVQNLNCMWRLLSPLGECELSDLRPGDTITITRTQAHIDRANKVNELNARSPEGGS